MAAVISTRSGAPTHVSGAPEGRCRKRQRVLQLAISRASKPCTSNHFKKEPTTNGRDSNADGAGKPA